MTRSQLTKARQLQQSTRKPERLFMATYCLGKHVCSVGIKDALDQALLKDPGQRFLTRLCPASHQATEEPRHSEEHQFGAVTSGDRNRHVRAGLSGQCKRHLRRAESFAA
nr:uncharacterized protein LOC105713207 [Aotus nancymaae]